ncbi:SIS domain-containing protein [Umboniibacter marinipuniceus]|uniref:Phosphoheptose isomerase n=1 Tax=Umboniibacter marinipuniceus TaxID=569599 RepID=A0A3M0A568_9GAMM|nr:SIS domain-containing protein [Umboniibacter marinipuniceus]RMA79920.1 phosphoheptose isomerase [Umboniibacter marinipuniceus]
MDLEQFIIEQFHESIAAKMAACEAIAAPLAEASELLTHTLVHEGRILACGSAEAASVVQQLTASLMHRLERERPALPIFSLNQDATAISAIANDHGLDDIYARQIIGLGQEGDSLVIITQQEFSPALLTAINAAKSRGMSIVILGGPDLDCYLSALGEDDIEIATPIEPSPRLTEVHQLAVACLIELLEAQLFGVDECDD